MSQVGVRGTVRAVSGEPWIGIALGAADPLQGASRAGERGVFGQFTECLPLELKPVIWKFPHPPSSTGSSLLESDKHIPGLGIPPGCFGDPFPSSLSCCKDDVAQVQRLDPPSVHCVSFLGCFSGEEVVHETASLPPSQGLELVVAWNVPPAELNRCPMQLRRMLCCREDLMGKAFMQHMSRMMFVLTRCAHFW